MKLFFWKKDQANPSLNDKIEIIIDGKKFQKFPKDINNLDESYRALIQELSKR